MRYIYVCMPYNILVQSVNGAPPPYNIFLCDPGPSNCVIVASSVNVPYLITLIPPQFQGSPQNVVVLVESTDPNYFGTCDPDVIINPDPSPNPTPSITVTPTITTTPPYLSTLCAGGFRGVSSIQNGTVIINGIIVRTNYTGDVLGSGILGNTAIYCAGTVVAPPTQTSVFIGQNNAFSLTLTFVNAQVNNVLLMILAGGVVNNLNYETYTVTTNTGTPTITELVGCHNLVNGNQISQRCLGFDVGAGVFQITNPSGTYGSMTISGNGGLLGSIIYICVSSLGLTPNPTTTPTVTPTIGLSLTPTTTQTLTPTATPTIELSLTPTQTPTTTVTLTLTSSPSPTKTSTLTPTPTRTPSQTPEITPSQTVTPSITQTLTPTLTTTSTLSPTPTTTPIIPDCFCFAITANTSGDIAFVDCISGFGNKQTLFAGQQILICSFTPPTGDITILQNGLCVNNLCPGVSPTPTPTPTPTGAYIVPSCSVFLVSPDSTSADLWLYDNTNNVTYYLNNYIIGLSPYGVVLDIANTSNMLYVLVEEPPQTQYLIYKYQYTSPFSATYIQTLSFPNSASIQSGLEFANGVLISANASNIITINPNTGVIQTLFAKPANRVISGDIIYTQGLSGSKLICLYTDTTTGDNYITQHSYSSGAVEVDKKIYTASTNAGIVKPLGLFIYSNNLYIVDSFGDKYLISATSPYNFTISSTIGIGLNGASNDSSCNTFEFVVIPPSPSQTKSPTPTPTPTVTVTNTPTVTPTQIGQLQFTCLDGIDVVFSLDYTKSMGTQINFLKTNISSIVSSIQTLSNNNYRLGLVIFDEYFEGAVTPPTYSASTLYTSIPASQKYTYGLPTVTNVFITSLIMMSLNNATNFINTLNILNTPSFPLGDGGGPEEPSDVALDLITPPIAQSPGGTGNFAGSFRPGVAKFIITISDNLCSYFTDDNFYNPTEISFNNQIGARLAANSIKHILWRNFPISNLPAPDPIYNITINNGGNYVSSFSDVSQVNNILYASCSDAPPQPTPSVTPTSSPLVNIVATCGNNNSDSYAVPAIINGVTVTYQSSGDVIVYNGPQCCASCGNSLPSIPNALVVGSLNGSFSVTYIFNQPVNNVFLTVKGTGLVNNSNDEVFNITVNTNLIPTLTFVKGCNTTINGNQVLSGSNTNDPDGAGFRVLVAYPTTYTTMTVSGPGGYGGSVLTLCVE